MNKYGAFYTEFTYMSVTSHNMTSSILLTSAF